jgi:hypothetical protein
VRSTTLPPCRILRCHHPGPGPNGCPRGLRCRAACSVLRGHCCLVKSVAMGPWLRATSDEQRVSQGTGHLAAMPRHRRAHKMSPWDSAVVATTTTTTEPELHERSSMQQLVTSLEATRHSRMSMMFGLLGGGKDAAGGQRRAIKGRSA